MTSARVFFSDALQMQVAGLKNIEVRHLLLGPIGTTAKSLLLGRDILFKHFSTSITRKPREECAVVTVTELEALETMESVPSVPTTTSHAFRASDDVIARLASKPLPKGGWKIEHLLFGDGA